VAVGRTVHLCNCASCAFERGRENLLHPFPVSRCRCGTGTCLEYLGRAQRGSLSRRPFEYLGPPSIRSPFGHARGILDKFRFRIDSGTLGKDAADFPARAQRRRMHSCTDERCDLQPPRFLLPPERKTVSKTMRTGAHCEHLAPPGRQGPHAAQKAKSDAVLERLERTAGKGQHDRNSGPCNSLNVADRPGSEQAKGPFG
jgi:hypothetical protein